MPVSHERPAAIRLRCRSSRPGDVVGGGGAGEVVQGVDVDVDVDVGEDGVGGRWGAWSV
ncbi:MAG: hypothetical protein ACRCYX_14090 [Dermatophilaceae bacterium]